MIVSTDVDHGSDRIGRYCFGHRDQTWLLLVKVDPFQIRMKSRSLAVQVGAGVTLFLIPVLTRKTTGALDWAECVDVQSLRRETWRCPKTQDGQPHAMLARCTSDDLPEPGCQFG